MAASNGPMLVPDTAGMGTGAPMTPSSPQRVDTPPKAPATVLGKAAGFIHQAVRVNADDKGVASILEPLPETDAKVRVALDFIPALYRPDAVWRWVYDCAILLITFYYWVTITHEWVLLSDNPVMMRSVYLDGFFSVVFIFDVWLCAFARRVSSVDFSLIPDVYDSVAHYVTSWFFLVDVLASFPFHIIAYAAGSMTMYNLFRNLLLLRVVRIPRLFVWSSVARMTPRYVRWHFSYASNIKLVLVFLAAAHVLAIMWISIKQNNCFQARREASVSSWLYNDSTTAVFEETWTLTATATNATNETAAPPSCTYPYFRALYFIVYTTSTVGYGDVLVANLLERIFAMILFSIGVTVNAVIVGRTAAVMMRSDLKTARAIRMNEAVSMLEYFKVPPSLSREVLSFLHHSLDQAYGSSVAAILGALPALLRNRVGLFIRIGYIQRVSLFQTAEPDCLVELAGQLESMAFSPGEMIVQQGAAGDCMFFIAHGVAEVVVNDVHVAMKTKGEFFGEVALLIASPRTASVRALTYCDVFRLDKDAFNNVLDLYPSFKRQIEREVTSRAQKVSGFEQHTSAQEEVTHSGPVKAWHRLRAEVSKSRIVNQYKHFVKRQLEERHALGSGIDIVVNSADDPPENDPFSSSFRQDLKTEEPFHLHHSFSLESPNVLPPARGSSVLFLEDEDTNTSPIETLKNTPRTADHSSARQKLLTIMQQLAEMQELRQRIEIAATAANIFPQSTQGAPPAAFTARPPPLHLSATQLQVHPATPATGEIPLSVSTAGSPRSFFVNDVDSAPVNDSDHVFIPDHPLFAANGLPYSPSSGRLTRDSSRPVMRPLSNRNRPWSPSHSRKMDAG